MKKLLKRLPAFMQNPYYILSVALGGAAAAIVLFSASKVVTLEIAGEDRTEVGTFARTAAGALRSADISLQEGDVLTPGPDDQISDGDVIRLIRASPVLIEVGGDLQQFRTTGSSVDEILSQGGWSVSPGDQIWIDGRLVHSPQAPLASRPIQIRLERGPEFYLESNDERLRVRSAASSIAGALWEGGVRLYAGDRLDPGAGGSPEEGVDVRLTRSEPVAVKVDGSYLRGRVVSKGITSALLELGLSLEGMDTTAPPPEEDIPATRQFEIIRRTEQVLIEQEPLPFETALQPDPELEIDNQRLLSAGAYGIRARRVRVRFENGEEVGRAEDEEWVIRESEPRVVGYGTDIVVRTRNTPDGIIEYWRAVQMHATSYSPCRIGGDACSQYTATGDRLRKGVAAVFVRWFPYMVGTQVYVPGYGFATILDNGAGGPWPRWIDLGYSDSNYQPWSQEVTVYFLTPIPENILYILN